MTCEKCDSACQGRLCRSCELTAQMEDAAADHDEEWYDCPSCGEDAAMEDEDCYRCRSDEQEVPA